MSAYAGGFVNVDVKVNETEILRLIAKVRAVRDNGPYQASGGAAAERGPTELASGEGSLDLGKVGQFERGGGLLGVFNDAGLVDDEGGAGTDGAQSDQVGQ